jgi:hypothetical protein
LVWKTASKQATTDEYYDRKEIKKNIKSAIGNEYYKEKKLKRIVIQ